MPNDLELDLSLSGTLPFDDARQHAFLGHVMDLKDDGLFLQVKDRIKPDWFMDPWAGQLYDAYLKFFGKWNRIPQSTAELFGDETIRVLDNNKKHKLSATIKLCQAEVAKFGRDTLVGDLSNWMKCRIFHHSVEASAKLFNEKKLEKAVGILQETVKEFQTVRFDGDPPSSWANPRELVKIQEYDYENALTTGCHVFDRHLNPDAPKGSLLRGDTTVLLAPTNIGKTTTMLTIARHNVVLGRSALVITLEGRQFDIQEKFWQCLLTKNKREFRNWVWSEDLAEKERYRIATSMLMRMVTHLHLTKPGLTVEEVVSIIRFHQAQRIAETGAGFDLLVVDYPAILSSARHQGQKWDYRQIQDYIYRQFVQLALDEKLHALLAVQTNREGGKVNKHQSSDPRTKARLVALEDVAESYAITTSATNLITINRDPEAQRRNRVTFYICKSRSSDVGWAIACKSDFSRATSHGDGAGFGGIAYHSSDPMVDRVDKWLAEKINTDIGPEYMH